VRPVKYFRKNKAQKVAKKNWPTRGDERVQPKDNMGEIREKGSNIVETNPKEKDSKEMKPLLRAEKKKPLNSPKVEWGG